MFTKKTLSMTILLVVALAACAPAMQKTAESMMEKPAATAAMAEKAMATDEMAGQTSSDDMMDKHATETTSKPGDDAMMEKSTPEASGANMEDKTGMMELPAWFDVTLTDVRSGEAFTIADFQGKVVLVETLAVWCSNCLKQQKEVAALHTLLGERGDFISLGLDIDPNEDGATLQSFTAKNGFDWKYAVAPLELGRDLAELYGDQFLNPPSTPMLIIDRHGEVHPLPFGVKSADDLLEALQPYLNEEM